MAALLWVRVAVVAVCCVSALSAAARKGAKVGAGSPVSAQPPSPPAAPGGPTVISFRGRCPRPTTDESALVAGLAAARASGFAAVAEARACDLEAWQRAAAAGDAQRAERALDRKTHV